MKEMNKRIEEVRKTLGLSMEKFGSGIGITRSSVNSLEKGINNPSEQTIRLICAGYNVNETWLRTGEGQMFNELTREEAITEYIAGLVSDNSKDRDFEKRFFRAMASLSKEQWLVVQEIMDKMVEDNEKS